ncbi:hypothetical protein JHK82_019087 [Glycine max]|uniref:Myb-like domain-containing protein n=2 Tax=Glycine subgen. Soja TaxID=1462606 RepID=A0A0R0JBH9_SOYBN|nr:hypothetical protein JHK87_018955 [Glycine soja]KAG5023184.1 hypothetical protein JHK85_019526 [Glycine max]KAG5143392.1 hypothetical protein JHK82_019087 [Glycine max]KAH1087391.1 hypothetical protein GYH30_018797 [Glycine max]RZC03465.1 Transcription factor MYB2 [Glycine soja]
MDVKKGGSIVQTEVKLQKHNEKEMGMRKGPWAVDENTILVNYITTHGEGHWNSVARCASMHSKEEWEELQILNYLCPDMQHGNITLQEHILILDLRSRWGNMLDVHIYNMDRVIKQAKQLKCDVNSKQFTDMLHYVWMSRLLERL